MKSTLLLKSSRYGMCYEKISCLLLLLGCFLFLTNDAIAQKESYRVPHKCGMEDLVKQARGEGLYDENNKEYQQFVKTAIEQYNAREAEKTDSDCPNMVVIPVAFHIFHDGTAVGAGFNFSEAVLNEVLGSLNADFGGYNTNKDLIDECFQDVDAYNTCIQFCMGTINRIDQGTCAACTGGCDYTQLYTCSQNAPNDFLNIYSAQFGGGLLGVASSIPFPGNPLGNCIEVNDGVYVDRESFTIGPPANAPFDGGKTLTHEIGHWLGLYHIGGDGTCANDDGLADTPTQNGQNGGCPAGDNDCTDPGVDKPDMYFNHMDYSNDACLAMFTKDQAAIMQAVLGFGGVNTPAPAGCRATLACSSQRGNCDNSLLSLDNTPNAANTQTIAVTDCSTENAIDFLDIQNAWYGYPTGLTCFNWVDASANDVVEMSDYEVDLSTLQCGGSDMQTYNLMMQTWDEENKMWGTEVAGGSVTVDVTCPDMTPTFATMPCAAQNNELSVTCPACPCTFDASTMNVTVELSGTHSWVSDLAFYLEGPSGTTVTMGSNGAGNCNNGDDFPNITFTSGGSNSYDVCTEPTPINNTFTVDFSMLDGEAIGTGWNLIIGDCVNGDTGQLDNYTVTISDAGGSCLTSPLVQTASTGWPITATDCNGAVTIPLTFTAPPGMADTPVWTAPDGTMTTGNTVMPAFGAGETMVTYEVQCPCSDPCPKPVIAELADCVPVELIAFTGKLNGSQVDLEWITATELDNSHFEIERSLDGNKFIALGKVLGAGTTVELQQYNFADLAPSSGINYYRLKQVDFSGAYEYSDVVAIEFGTKVPTEVFPSPASDFLTVKSDKEIIEIKVIDITGRVVSSFNNVSENTTELNVSNLLSGTYFVSVVMRDGDNDILRFVKN